MRIVVHAQAASVKAPPMSLFVILLGGRLTATPRLKKQVEGARVIAADSGMAHAEPLGLAPEVWVGDFDSAGPALQEKYAHVPRLVFPQDKDATDGEIACDEAIRRGATRLILAGAFGGQSDHFLGTLMLSLRFRLQNIEIMMTSGDEEGWPLAPGHLKLDLQSGTRISVVAITELASLSMAGVKWPLQGRRVPLGSSLTLSNVATGPVSITSSSGNAIVMAYP